jgi:hypothetical protein
MRPIVAASMLALLLGACAFPDTMLWHSAPAQAQALPPPAAPPPQAAAPAPLPPAAPVERRRPFVIIRFEAPDPDYARPLYEALQGALQRKPGVAFDLVAVTRNADDAQRNLASVYQTVTNMGLPPDRLSLSAVAAADGRTDEVWIYAR